MRKHWAWVWVLCGTVALVLAGLWAGWGGTLASTGGSVLSTVITTFGVLSVWAWRNGARRGRSRTDQLKDAEDALARSALRQWRDEAQLRQLFDTAPLPVVWSGATGDGLGERPPWTGGPVECRADRPAEPAEAFRRLPRPRLVVLGDAGSGKSTFTVMLALALLESRADGAPVPVLLSAASLDQDGGNALDWLCRRIAVDHPALTDPDTCGPSAIEDLLAGHRVLPVIDGLDELPPAAAAALLTALDEGLDTHAPLLLTCRTDAWTVAVAAVVAAARAAPGELAGAPARALAGAPAIAPRPVRAQDAVEALRAGRASGWETIADHVQRHPRGAVAQALRSPLMVVLARTVYADPGADPDELTRRRSPQAVEDHLLDALVPAVYARARRRDPGGTRPWSPERAHHYLAQLAAGMERQDTHDLSWWRLHQWVPALAHARSRAAVWTAVLLASTLAGYGLSGVVPGLPPRERGAALGYALAVAVALPCLYGVAAWWAARRGAAGAHGMPGAVLAAVCGGVAFAVPDLLLGRVEAEPGWFVVGCVAVMGFAFLLVLRTTGLPVPPHLPGRGTLTTRNWRHRLPRAAVTFVVTTVLTAAALRLYAMVVRPAHEAAADASSPAPELPWAYGLTMGAVLGAVQALLHWVRGTTGPDDLITPSSAVRADRLVTLVGAGIGVLLVTLPLDIAVVLKAASPAHGPVAPEVLRAVATLVLGVGPTGLVLALAASSWPHYTAARLVLAARGRLPWRLQAFLDDAHELGLLRQVGPVHQFRHARLRERMARHGRLPRPRTAVPDAGAPSHR
ncbi:NACHT domain-containing protein [Streptomyces lavendulocolor]|uniref:NACHT domain-containing protein n=1 Tax=Streptomyces lavendulocolor TaxID=67316 RepID=UPI0031D81E98